MKTSLDHLPEDKRRELRHAAALLHEEFEDALKDSKAAWKKKGRILKIILFGSYARGGWVDEKNTGKGYRSDFDLLVVVNNKKLADYARYWHKAKDRLIRDAGVDTPVSFIVHSRRFVNDALRKGQYFFSDIRREGVALYELDDEPLAEPRPLTAQQHYEAANEHFEERYPASVGFLDTARYVLGQGREKEAAFQLHQAIEQAYSALLLTLTNYSPPSHNIVFLRSLSEDRDRRLVDAWPRDLPAHRARFNTLKEAYVKARYSRHYHLDEEALTWLGDRTEHLHGLIETVCKERLEKLKADAGAE